MSNSKSNESQNSATATGATETAASSAGYAQSSSVGQSWQAGQSGQNWQAAPGMYAPQYGMPSPPPWYPPFPPQYGIPDPAMWAAQAVPPQNASQNPMQAAPYGPQPGMIPPYGPSYVAPEAATTSSQDASGNASASGYQPGPVPYGYAGPFAPYGAAPQAGYHMGYQAMGPFAYGAPCAPSFAHAMHDAAEAQHQDEHFAQIMQVCGDLMQGKTDPAKVAGLLSAGGGTFWKGAIVGALLAFVVSNDSVKATLSECLGGIFGGGGESE